MYNTVPEWYKSAVFYQIFPASFNDSNGDGIGDLKGIEQKLPYLEGLGITAIWLCPCFDSPFLDAGYDVRDFYKIAPRYGTNADMKRLCKTARKHGIRILLDFVAPHTSIDHPWFIESCKQKKNKYTNRYIWTDSMYTDPDGGTGCMRGYGEREGTIATNFFWSQPKLNYGFVNPDPNKPWQLSIDHPDVQATWAEMKDIARFWLDMGVSGYRLDSAKSIVPGDPRHGKGGTARFWEEMRAMFDKEYPEAVLIGEWGWPCDADKAGMHGSFLLHNMRAYTSLFAKPGWENYSIPAFFEPSGGDISVFAKDYMFHYEQLDNPAHIALMTTNHDYKRPGTGRSAAMMKTVFAMLLTMPGAPFIYYGDEIGMTSPNGLTSVEGAYRRTSSRTPMQWDGSKNAGFSKAAETKLYLPVGKAASTVAEQEGKKGSLLETVRALITLRHNTRALQADTGFEILYAKKKKYPFVYLRQEGEEKYIIAINPSAESVEATFPWKGNGEATTILGPRTKVAGKARGKLKIEMGKTSFGIFRVE